MLPILEEAKNEVGLRCGHILFHFELYRQKKKKKNMVLQELKFT